MEVEKYEYHKKKKKKSPVLWEVPYIMHRHPTHTLNRKQESYKIL